MRTWALVAALFFLQAPDFSAEGMKALEEGRYEAAAQLLSKAVAADPQEYSAHFNLALAYGFLHKDAEGIAEYRKTLELKPALYEAELNLGILLMRQKEPADALPLFEDAAKQKPDVLQPRYYLSEALLETAAWDRAEESFRLAAGMDPKSAAAEFGLAQAMARQGKLGDSEPHFRRAAELDPNYRNALLDLAQLYEKNQQSAEALAIYREFPDNPRVQEHLGQMMLESKQYADAIPRLEAAYNKEANQSNRVALAAAYVFTSHLEQALPLLTKAVEIEPSNYDVRMMLARALRDRRQFGPAASQFYEAAKLKPAESKTWDELGNMLYMMGDFPKSLASFDRARELGDNSAGNCFLRAIILDKLKQLKPAIDAYRQFLTLSQGKNPDQEFQARQRMRIMQKELEKR